MIIGNGLIAKAFSISRIDISDIVIFASGVSKSTEKDKYEFQREVKLLEDVGRKYRNSKIIYFSTSSQYDKDKIDTAYVQHKIKMEKYIKNNFKDFLIVRLPQIIGHSTNNNTLINNFVFKIQNDQEIEIYMKAKRNLLSITDIVRIVAYIINHNLYPSQEVNIANIQNTSILEIVETLEKILSKKAIKKYLDKGSEYHIDTTEIETIYKEIKIDFSDYVYNSLYKEYGN